MDLDDNINDQVITLGVTSDCRHFLDKSNDQVTITLGVPLVTSQKSDMSLLNETVRHTS